VRLLATALAKRMTAAHMYRHSPLQIRERKVNPAIPAIGRAKEGEQGLVLVYWQQLPVAKCPPLRRKIERENPDFRKEWLGHSELLLVETLPSNPQRAGAIGSVSRPAISFSTTITTNAVRDQRERLRESVNKLGIHL
jgi:hypothetical protein